MKIFLNGKEEVLPDPLTVRELLERMKIAPELVACELNREIVRRKDYSTVKITEGDHAKIKILPITRLGLVEMTRERRRESLQAMTCEACEECAGSGWVLSRDSLFLKIRKEIIDLTQGRPDGSLKIYLLGIVAQYMRENKERLEKQVGRSIEIFEDQTLPWEHYRIILE